MSKVRLTYLRDEEWCNFKVKAAVQSSIYRRLSSDCRFSTIMICVRKKRRRRRRKKKAHTHL